MVHWPGWQEFTLARAIGLALLVAGGILTVQRYGLDWPRIIDNYFNIIVADLLVLGAAALVVEGLNRRRRKQTIIMQMGSPDGAIAREAVRLAYWAGWIKDGSLRGARLHEANWQGILRFNADMRRAKLENANFKEANLDYADLQEAVMTYTNLQGAWLGSANLRAAKLSHANLEGAHLSGANLQDAYLGEANLKGAHLWQADLRGATFTKSKTDTKPKFDETTTLPDDTKWTPKTDMARFTDPNHPEFWKPSEG